MATGVSTTHTSPFRPFCFPYSLAYRSCCSCSVPLTSRSTRALHRLEHQITSYNINRYNSSIGFQHYSGKTSIDNKTCNWKLETDTCASKASMLQLYLDQRFSGGKLCTRTIVNQERMGVKGGKLPRNFRRVPAVEVIKNYPCGRKGFSTAAHCSESLRGTAVAWKKEGENLARQKKEHTFVGEMKFQRNGSQCAYPSEVKCTLKTEPFYRSQLTKKQACSEIVGSQHSAIKNYAAPIQPQPSQGAQYSENVGWHVNTKNFDASSVASTESMGMATGPRPLCNVNGQCLDGPCETDMLFINGQGEGAQARGSFMEDAIVKGEFFEQNGDVVVDVNKCQLGGRKTTNVIDNYDTSALAGTESKVMATGPRPLYNVNSQCLDGPCKSVMPFINLQGEGTQVFSPFRAESIVKGEKFEQIGDEVADVNKCQLDGTESKGVATGPRPLDNVNGQCLDGQCKRDMPFINRQGEDAQARGSFRVESIVKGEKFEQIGDEVADVNKCRLDGGQTTNVTDRRIKSSDKDEACVSQADLQKRLIKSSDKDEACVSQADLQKRLIKSSDKDEACVSQADLQKRLIKSSDKDEACVSQADLQKRLTSIYHDVLVVDNICKAKEVVGMLTSRYRHLVHACDTEVANIDVKQETPVDHGEVICFSIYSGPEADFGNGKSCIWVDVLDGGGRALFLEFAPFFEDPFIRKVWHNYSFDNHIIENYGLKLSGFYADTMHMARLWDSSRRLEGGYSLEALTGDKRVMSSAGDEKTKPGSSAKESTFKARNQRTVSKAIWLEGGYSLEVLPGDKRVMSSAGDKVTKPGSSEKRSTFEARNQRTASEANSQNIMPQAGSFHEDLLGKISMKTIFGRRKVKKDGLEGKMITIAPVEELQREERELWICYSALDAKSTLKLYESLRAKLLKMPWKLDGEPILGKNMFNFYLEYWQPFGGLLVEMETEGMLVDRDYLAHIEKVAKTEQEVAVNRFREWASRYCPDAKYMNVGSDTQLRQLLFGDIKNGETDDGPSEAKEFKVPNVDNVVEEGKKAPKKYQTIKLRRIVSGLSTDIYTPSGCPSVSGVALRTLAGKLAAKVGLTDDELLLKDEIIETLDGSESCNSNDANENDDGAVFKAFECKNETKEACLAIASLCEICSIDSLISNFILPLQGSNISGESGRVHCSLNINTETGRLSARRPNLQNQPALEKDRYKIRQAFVAAPGNSLIVADYGQLELRILAHLANCKSMLHAFEAGGDFHSRTAMNMYSNVREAVEKREVLLEWYPQPGEERPPVPLLKDAFASERRKAKMLNFSIAYGKTPVGLSRDWKVSVNEAKKTVDLWYRERQEVLEWQEARKIEALKTRHVHTLLGRARKFPSVSGNRSLRGHIERAAINTPVQGSAADVVMCAMLEISKNLRLKELGWRLLLQVHDEVILEGPTETAEVAKEIVVECMSKPFNGKNFLRVGLSVDAKCAQNWYAGK